MNRRLGFRHVALALALLGPLAGVILLWSFRDYLRSPQALYREAAQTVWHVGDVVEGEGIQVIA